MKKILIEGQEVYNNDDPIFEVTEEPAQYPGGQGALMQFLAQHLRYPIIAQENGVQGRVLVQFVIEKDGSLSNFIVTKSSSVKDNRPAGDVSVVAQKQPTEAEAQQRAKMEAEAYKALDTEAVNVLQGMPNWIPAKQRGQTVRMKYTLPITFRLQ